MNSLLVVFFAVHALLSQKLALVALQIVKNKKEKANGIAKYAIVAITRIIYLFV